MRYLLLISADESRTDGLGTPAKSRQFHAWMDDLVRRGVLVAHEGLRPSPLATTVRVREDQVLLTDGPYLEGKDQIGGFALIDVDDLDAAIEIAAGHPATSFGQVEIRPVIS